MDNKKESLAIFQTLCSDSMYKKYLEKTGQNITECLSHVLAVLYTKNFAIMTGSAAEGTAIIQEDFLHSTTPGDFSDVDVMKVLGDDHVIDEVETLPQRFDDHIYCRAERGKHTTDGFRKLRIIHCPEYYADSFHISNGYISSSRLLISTRSDLPVIEFINTGLGTQGPSQVTEINGYPFDSVMCFYVKTWPKEAESWFTRQTRWPGRKCKSQIRSIGYLLVAIGNRNSQESDLEWRCSFSIAEKILFQSLTIVQICTFVMLKALLKEYLPSDINTDREKKMLTTYHMKTLFLWCLEDSQVKWKPEDFLDTIDHLLDVLVKWIDGKYFPHYFIPSVNLLDARRLDERGEALVHVISEIRKNLLKNINQSQFFMGQKILFKLNERVLEMCLHNRIFECITGNLQRVMHTELFNFKDMDFLGQLNTNSHSMLIEGLISIKLDVHPQLQYLYRVMYTDPVYDKLLMEVMPGLIDQYRGCIHLAKYCMAARDGRILSGVLHTAESLLKDTMHLDPCSGHVKLACLYMVTGDFTKAMVRLSAAEKNFQYLFRHKNIETSTLISSHELLDKSDTTIRQIFQKWVEGQITSDIVVAWPEYITVPDLLQFELIHENTQQVINSQHVGGVVGLNCPLKWPPLSLIKLLKFVCAFYSGRSSITHMENLAVDLFTSIMSLTIFEDIKDSYSVFNMAAWCYVKIKKYKHAAHLMKGAIVTNVDITDLMKRSNFSHYFLTYIIEQCLASGSRILVYKRDNVWPVEAESWFTRETMSGQWKQSPGLQERQCLATASRILVYKRDNVPENFRNVENDLL